MNWLNKLFQRPPVIIVSGLPRSGTSLMMQMLAAGGVPILSDQIRTADDDNPKGYYEFERVKKLPEGDMAWLNDAPGKAVKIISALLKYLPGQYTYRILFMQRDMGEILASQQQMLIRRKRADGGMRDANLARQFEQHLEEVHAWLKTQPNIQVLPIQHAALLASPEQLAQQVKQFVPLPLDVVRMSEVPDRSLHRQKAA